MIIAFFLLSVLKNERIQLRVILIQYFFEVKQNFQKNEKF